MLFNSNACIVSKMKREEINVKKRNQFDLIVMIFFYRFLFKLKLLSDSTVENERKIENTRKNWKKKNSWKKQSTGIKNSVVKFGQEMMNRIIIHVITKIKNKNNSVIKIILYRCFVLTKIKKNSNIKQKVIKILSK